MERVLAGVISLIAPEQGLRSGTSREALRREARLVQALNDRGRSALAGGAPYPEEDRLADSSALLRTHVHTLLDVGVGCLILRVEKGARAGDALECAVYAQREFGRPMGFVVTGDPSHESGVLPALLAVSGALGRNGFAPTTLAGHPDDPAFLEELLGLLDFHEERSRSRDAVVSARHRLKKQKCLFLGDAAHRTTGNSLDTDAILRWYGVNVDVLSETALRERLALLRTDPAKDARMRLPGTLACPRGALEEFWALTDLARERDATCLALQPEALEHAEWVLLWLGADIDPAGRPKDPLPTGGDGDVHATATAVVLRFLSQAPTACPLILGVERPATLRVDLPPTHPRGPVTLAMGHASRTGPHLTVWEGNLETGGGPVGTVTLQKDVDLFLGEWPSRRALVVAGHLGAALAEFAHESDFGFLVVDRTGRTFRR